MIHESPLFDSYFNNAQLNSMLVLQLDGTVLDINRAFTTNFGYTKEAIIGKNFSMLFTGEDRQHNKPQRELRTVIETGQAADENYVVNSSGQAVWAIGESLLVSDTNGQQYIVKDVVNLQAKKQLQLFLMQTEELLERIFESSKDAPMMVLDGSMKVVKANPAFLNLFELPQALPSGIRLSDIPHPFWQDENLKKELSSIIIKNQPLKHRKFRLQTSAGEKTMSMDSRIIEPYNGDGRKIFLLIEEALAQH